MVETHNNPEILDVGTKRWPQLLRELKTEVRDDGWKEQNGRKWDTLIRPTDKVKKEGDKLQLIRNNTTYDIASLKSEMSKGTSEEQKVPTTKKEITVVAGDSISKIVQNWFKNDKPIVGPKDAGKNQEWATIYRDDTLVIRADGKWPDGTYKYIISGRKNGKGSDIPVSSKEDIFANSTVETSTISTVAEDVSSRTENREGTKSKAGTLYFTDKKEWDHLDDNPERLKAIRLAIKAKNSQFDTSKWEATNTQNEWMLPGETALQKTFYRVKKNGKAERISISTD